VHDELVFEVHKDLVDEVKPEIDRLMIEVAKLQVPLVVDMGTGKNWNEAH
jgi:DNA polymerase-1